jgi:hypothetical protein
MVNVFISYADKDKQRVIPVLDPLRNIQDVKMFFAEESISPGAEISKTIADAIRRCDLFLLFYSISAMQSNYVQQEIGLAKANNKLIIPILLDGTKPNAMLLGVNYVDLSDPSKVQSEFNRLYSFIISNVKQQHQGQVIGFLALVALGCLIFFGKK